MAVSKFRDLSEMQRSLWSEGGAAPVRRLAEVLEFWRRALPRRRPRGVARFRSLEEANQAREDWVSSEVERLRRERQD